MKDRIQSSVRRVKRRALRSVATVCLLGGLTVLAGCYGGDFDVANAPLPGDVIKTMDKLGVTAYDPIFIRVFKKEAELEVWKRQSSGEMALLKTYEICAWSGELGPKFKEGDRQAPEGFYSVTPGLMNPNSSFHLAFNLGFPNAFDRSHDRTGSFLMVHGACSSAGCYSMENDQMEEIYALARDAFTGGQQAFQVHAFPFRMTPENMALFSADDHMPFWRNLKEGYEHFELTRMEPIVHACGRRYVFNATAKDDETFEADKPCPDYEVTPALKRVVDAKILGDRARERAITKSWTTPEERRYRELTTRLKIEKERVQRFADRGLGFSSHQKRRVVDIERQLADLGFVEQPVVANIPSPRPRPLPGSTASGSDGFSPAAFVSSFWRN
ncbi:MAG: murein L,D-transpeptidase family protein [Pseudomonadota bacterium]